jgi:hypothetical protein
VIVHTSTTGVGGIEPSFCQSEFLDTGYSMYNVPRRQFKLAVYLITLATFDLTPSDVPGPAGSKKNAIVVVDMGSSRQWGR